MEKEPIGNAKRHKLLDIYGIAICAVICGTDSWSDGELFGKNKRTWLKKFLELPKGLPSLDTFGQVFALLAPDEFGKRFMAWVRGIFELIQGQGIAMDGKQLRGSVDGRMESLRSTWSVPWRQLTRWSWGRSR